MASEIFTKIASALKTDPSIAQKVNGVYQFTVAENNKAWVVDLKGNAGVKEGAGQNNCNLTFKTEQDLVDVMTGKANAQQAFGSGKLKIGGDMMLAMKLEALKKALASAPAGAAPAPAAAAAPSGGSRLATVFGELAKNVQGNPGLVKQINGIYKFNIDGKIWIVDLKNAPGSVKEGTAADNADCTIMMKENDFVDMMSGTLDGQSAFMQGKLKLTGNMALAMKLSQLRSNAPKAKL